MREDAARYIDQNGLGEFVEFFVSAHAGPRALKQKVSQWRGLDVMAHNYAKFVHGHAPVLKLWRGSDAPQDSREAFRAYIPMVTEWRRLPFLDPDYRPTSCLPYLRGDVSRRAARPAEGVQCSAHHAVYLADLCVSPPVIGAALVASTPVEPDALLCRQLPYLVQGNATRQASSVGWRELQGRAMMTMARKTRSPLRHRKALTNHHRHEYRRPFSHFC